ncbi:MAG: methyltransferase domain-containing protein [Pirellulales bacterium]
MWSWFVEQTDLLDGRPKSMLHVAPEKCFEPKLRRALGSGYVTADLTKNTDVQMDICSIPFPDEHFDVVYCSHVLEHVPDDRRAMHELCRVLKPTGWAVLLVPVTRERTIEDPSITDPAERERLFGQHDHVRRYGPDYADRLREAGFHVAHTAAREIHPPERLRRLGLATAETERDGIFTCTKA